MNVLILEIYIFLQKHERYFRNFAQIWVKIRTIRSQNQNHGTSTNTAPPRVQYWGCISLTTGGIFKLSTLNQPHGSVRYESSEKWMFSFWKNIYFCDNVKDYAQIWVRFESKSDYPIICGFWVENIALFMNYPGQLVDVRVSLGGSELLANCPRVVSSRVECLGTS